MIILGLGANIGEREKNIIEALLLLSSDSSIQVEKISSLYETEPVGKTDQPRFLNAVAIVKTDLSPVQLLEKCLDVEKQMGRIREGKWGPRNIDIDILIYNNEVIQSERLQLPHPFFHERSFVLVPVCEIAPDFVVFKGLTAKQLVANLSDVQSVNIYKKIL